MALSDTQVRAAKPADKQYKLTDGEGTLLLKSIQKFRLGSDFFRVSNIVIIGRCLSTNQVCNDSLRRIQVFWQYLAPHG